jgi:Flp pilus assembly pilin Flp
MHVRDVSEQFGSAASVSCRGPKTTRSGLAFSFTMMFIAMAIISALQTLGPRWAKSLLEPSKLDGLVEVSSLLASFISVLILHEAGHLAAAILMRFELLALSLGPFRIAHLHGKWSFQFSAKTLLSGSLSAIPRSNEFFGALGRS